MAKHVRGRKPRGRPRTHRESWAKLSIVLFERQVLKLDRLTMTIRSRTGAVLSRAAVIRALLDSIIHSQIDITNVASENDLKRVVMKRLSRKP